MTRRIALLLTVAVASSALLAWWTLADRDAPVVASEPVAQAPALLSPTPEPTLDTAACQFDQGDRFEFAYQSTTRYAFADDALLGATPSAAEAETSLNGTLSFEVLTSPSESGTVLLGRLTGVNANAVAAVGETLTAPFLARLTGRCEVAGFAYHRSTARAAGRAQQVVLHDLSFSVPTTSGATTEVMFDTGVGRARTLVATADPAGTRVHRKPLNYAKFWSPKMEGTRLTDGQLEVVRGGSKWFESLSGFESLEGGALKSSRMDLQVQARPADPSHLLSASRKLEDYVWENLLPLSASSSAALSPQGATADHLQRVAQMKEVSFEIASKRFEVLLESGANIDTQWRDMAAWMDAHPEGVSQFVEQVVSEDFPDGWKAPAFLALSQARAPEARDALLDIFRNRQVEAGDRIRSSLALATRKDVGVELARELRAEGTRASSSARDRGVSQQALLHLGVLSGTRPDEQDVAMEAREAVKQLASKATVPEDYSVLFGMVGNMADGTMLPQIESWSRLPDVAIRELVPNAVRRYKPELVQALLLGWLRRETSPDVKRSLFNTIHHMFADAGRPVDEALMLEGLRHLKEGPGVLARQSLIHIVGPYASSHREVNEALQAQLKFELEEKSGLFSLVTQYLPSRDIYRALATVDSLKGQFGHGLPPSSGPETASESAAPPPEFDLPIPNDVTPPPAVTSGGQP